MPTTITLPSGWEAVEPQATTVDQLCDQLFNFGTLAWRYRGEPQWFPDRRSSLGRFLSATAPTPVQAECDVLARFCHLANAHLTYAEREYVRDDLLGWMALMQHHGGPTRLLDWTLSPWVAAYCASRENRDRSGFIWGFNPLQIQRPPTWIEMQKRLDKMKTFDEYRNAITSVESEMVLCFSTIDATPRMTAQQGAFTFGHPARVDHANVIGRHIPSGNAKVLVIHNSLKRDLMARMQAMNITAATLFPGLDGAGRTVCDIARNGIPTPWMLSPLE